MLTGIGDRWQRRVGTKRFWREKKRSILARPSLRCTETTQCRGQIGSWGTSLVVQWLWHFLSMCKVWVCSLVRELGVPHALWPKNWNMKQKQYCNGFTKDFRFVHVFYIFFIWTISNGFTKDFRNGPYKKNIKNMNKSEVGYLNLKLNEEVRDKNSNLGGMAK